MSDTVSRMPVVALAGNPNVGKSTLFNRLTGMNQHTGNWPGKTVALAQGHVTWRDQVYTLVDLPGTYSLHCRSREEQIAQSFIASQEADCVVVVCDGTALERNLILAQQVMELHDRVILCINLMDEARRRNITIHSRIVSQRLGIPVVTISAGRKTGLSQLQKVIFGVLSGQVSCAPQRLGTDATSRELIARAEEVCEAAVHRSYSAYEGRQKRLDQLLTSKHFGFPIMLCLLFFVIWLTVWGANYPSALLSQLFQQIYLWLHKLLTVCHFPPGLTGFLMDGIYATVSRVISVMLPPMAIFFPMFTLLEDAGYLPRAAFLMDHGLSRCGACGKQALTMCMGLGCNAAGVTGCRIIDSPRERLIAILTNSFMPCNGRFPSLILLGTIFFGGHNSSLFAALLITALVGLGAVSSMSASWVLSKTILKGETSTLILEMPPYRKPRVLQVLLRSFIDRTAFVAGRAVLVALPAGALLWLCGNITCGGHSLMALLEDYLNPAGVLLGMNGAILLSFLLAIPANELTIPILLMSLTGAGTLAGEMSTQQVGSILAANGWSWQTALCTMVFILFHWPCGTTLITVSKEAGGKKWAILSFLLPTIYGAALCVLLNLLFRLV